MKIPPAVQLLIADAENADRWIGSEAELQEATARLLDGLGLLWFHPANERNTKIYYTRKGKAYTPEGNRLKRQGVKPGVPDVIIFQPTGYELEDPSVSLGCAIELKYGRNTATPAQMEWLKALQNQGWHCDIARSMEDVIRILRECGYINENS